MLRLIKLRLRALFHKREMEQYLKQSNLETTAIPSLCLPFSQALDSNPGPVNPFTGTLAIVLRADSDAGILAPSVRVNVWEVDPDQPIAQMATMDELLSLVTGPGA